MISTFDIFVNLSIFIFSLFLLLNQFGYLIDLSGKIITSFVRISFKIFVIFLTLILIYSWVTLLTLFIIDIYQFYIGNNYNINFNDIKNIVEMEIVKIFNNNIC